jgi:tRNA dimethylallyltransferase
MNAVLYGFDDMPTAAEETRNTLNELYVRKGLQHLQEMLKEYDPVYYSEVDINNPQRIIRALEVCKSTGRPFSEFRKKSIINRPFDFIKIGLNTDRAILYNNINKRVDNMMESGLLEEAKRLLPYRNLNALNTVGYSELFNYFDRKHSLQEAIEIIKQNTRRFAKRQLTWFNKLDDIKWFEPKEFDKITGYLNSFLYHPEPGE